MGHCIFSPLQLTLAGWNLYSYATLRTAYAANAECHIKGLPRTPLCTATLRMLLGLPELHMIPDITCVVKKNVNIITK